MAKSCCNRTTPQKASVMPSNAPFSSGCGQESVCEKYCCEHWVLSHSAHTANRCYSEKNKTQIYSKGEHFSSYPYHEPQAPTRRPAARNNLTPCHMGQGLAGHPQSVKLGSEISQTSELRPYETAVKDDYIEADPLANMPRGLVLFTGFERRLLSHPNKGFQEGQKFKENVHLESIHSAGLFSHVVMLQPYSNMDLISYFPQNSINNTP